MTRNCLLLVLVGCQEYGIVGKGADVTGLADTAVPLDVGPEEPLDTGEDAVEEPPPEEPPPEAVSYTHLTLPTKA